MRILEICTALDGGGVDRYLFNYCGGISEISFDFAVSRSRLGGMLEQPLKEQGSRVFPLTELKKGWWKNQRELREILETTQYDAVHVHLGYKGLVALRCAKRCGIPVRIAHAHSAYEPESFPSRLFRKILTAVTRHYATALFACGQDAAQWTWGSGSVRRGEVWISHNAIDTAQYAFSPKVREKQREALGIAPQTLVLGNVGRLSYQKNQSRLLKIFAALRKQRPDSLLLLVGSGGLEGSLRQEAESLGVAGSVRFLGLREDVPQLLNAMDVFVFPSVFEGFGIVLLETQCNGLPAISSDRGTQEAFLSEAVFPLQPECSDEDWVERILSAAERGRIPEAISRVIEAGYEISRERDRLKERYQNLIEKG